MGKDCGCNKNARPTGFGVSSTQEQIDQNLAAQRATLNGAQEQALASGSTTQSFTMRDRSGTVQSFGSRLERNAFIAREGGTIIP